MAIMIHHTIYKGLLTYELYGIHRVNNIGVMFQVSVGMWQELKLEENSELVMPPKPPDVMHGAGIAFYNIDFSLQHQLQLAGAPPTPGTGDTPSM
jgi:hypothetical protein